MRPTIGLEQFELFVDGLDHPEGLAFAADGSLWAGGELGQIYRIDRRGRVKEVARLGGFNLGLTFSRDHDLYVCNLKKHALVQIDRRGNVKRSWSRAAGRKLQSPNFSVFDSQGNLYFTDSGTWMQNDGFLYLLRPNGRVEELARGLAFPNGLALSADEKTLFLVQSTADNVLSFPVRPGGTTGKARVYASALARVPDGAVLDAEGSLYVTCYASHCIYKITPARKVVLLAQDPCGTAIAGPTNAAFGGENFDEIYIANLGRWHICRAPAGVKGQPLVNQR